MIAAPRNWNRTRARAYHETSETSGLISSADHWPLPHRLSLSDQLSLSRGPRPIGSACLISSACQRGRSDQLSLSDRLRLWEGCWPIGSACLISLADPRAGNHRLRLCWYICTIMSLPAYVATGICCYRHMLLCAWRHGSTPVLQYTSTIENDSHSRQGK